MINIFKLKTSNSVKKVGFYSAIATTVLTLFTFGIAIFTPPLSGPFCKQNCYEYPYLDIASRFPRDYYWMFPAIFLYISFLILIASVYQDTEENKKIFGLTGFSFALLSSLVFITDFFLQLSVIQPSLLNGEVDGVSLFSQFNPHGIFIALEELGYLLMNLSFIFIAFTFNEGGLRKNIKRLLISCFTLNLIALAFYLSKYGIFREYRFEVATITINWLTLIILGILLSLNFKKVSV